MNDVGHDQTTTADKYRRYFEVANVSGDDIPPHSLVRVVRIGTMEIPEVARPDQDDTPPFRLLVTGAVTIRAGTTGPASYDHPIPVRYASDDPYAYDPETCDCDEYGFDYFGPNDAEDTWGSRAGSWALHKGNKGWFVLGGANGCFVFAVRDPAAGFSGSGSGSGYGLGNEVQICFPDCQGSVPGSTCVTIGPFPFNVGVSTDFTPSGG